MAERYFQHTFPNGLTLLCEKMPGMHSAAMSLLVPSGSSSDPEDGQGSATVICDMVLRGAGERNNRQLTEYLDSLGLQRGSGVGTYHTRFACSAVANKVLQGMPAYADIIMRPMMPPEGFAPSRDLALQALEGIEDEPRQILMIKLRERHLPAPLGRNGIGKKEHLEKLTLDAIKADRNGRYHSNGAIMSIAGNIEFEKVRDEVERNFGNWSGKPAEPLELVQKHLPYHFEHSKSEQTHIGLAYPSIPETHPDYYVAMMAAEALGGGMSGRLFTEIREKRALCYSVHAGYSSLKGIGAIFGYAGTSNERAQATLDCFIEELHRLSKGIIQAELDRAKIGLKAGTIMSSESTGSRSGAIAHDYFMRGRIRGVEEIKQAVDAVTLDQVNAYLKENKPGPFTIVIVGPKELKVPTSE